MGVGVKAGLICLNCMLRNQCTCFIPNDNFRLPIL